MLGQGTGQAVEKKCSLQKWIEATHQGVVKRFIQIVLLLS